MKTGFSLAVLLGIIGFFPIVYAGDIKLKSSCIRANPAVVGETDPSLLGIYEQLCDKKNKEFQITYLVKAAQRFHQIGQNYKALQIVAELEKVNVQSITLTDVKLVASTEIANSALMQLKDVEKRRLTLSDTYSSVKEFADLSKVASIQPLSLSKGKATYKQTSLTEKPKNVSRNVTNKKKVVAPSKSKPVVAPVQQKSSTNPFSSL